MKTFQEALHTLAAKEDLTEANIIESHYEQMLLPEFVTIIQGMADDHVKNVVASAKDEKSLRALICATLHMAFCLGLQVGIEMEKAE